MLLPQTVKQSFAHVPITRNPGPMTSYFPRTIISKLKPNFTQLPDKHKEIYGPDARSRKVRCEGLKGNALATVRSLHTSNFTPQRRGTFGVSPGQAIGHSLLDIGYSVFWPRAHTSQSTRKVLPPRIQPGQSTLLRRLMNRPIQQFPSIASPCFKR